MTKVVDAGYDNCYLQSHQQEVKSFFHSVFSTEKRIPIGQCLIHLIDLGNKEMFHKRSVNRRRRFITSNLNFWGSPKKNIWFF
jgi:hypothetical protein